MSRLLIANFARLKKSKLFWCMVGLMFAFALFRVINLLSFPDDPAIDSILFFYPLVIGIAITLFISIFLGTEYSDGTIRNKLIVGHIRSYIYLSNFIVSIAAAFIMFVAYMLPIIVIGFPVFGLPTMGGAEYIGNLATSLLTLVAFCALHTMVSMIYSNKAGATAINLLVEFALLFVVLVLFGKLTAPELVPNYDNAGNIIEYVSNPYYPSSIEKAIYQAIVDILPIGQAMQYGEYYASPIWRLVVCAVAVIVVCTIIGIVAFNKKNIK